MNILEKLVQRISYFLGSNIALDYLKAICESIASTLWIKVEEVFVIKFVFNLIINYFYSTEI